MSKNVASMHSCHTKRSGPKCVVSEKGSRWRAGRLYLLRRYTTFPTYQAWGLFGKPNNIFSVAPLQFQIHSLYARTHKHIHTHAHTHTHTYNMLFLVHRLLVYLQSPIIVACEKRGGDAPRGTLSRAESFIKAVLLKPPAPP